MFFLSASLKTIKTITKKSKQTNQKMNENQCDKKYPNETKGIHKKYVLHLPTTPRHDPALQYG